MAFTKITPTAAIEKTQHGGRAKCLQRLIRLDMPVPTTVALSFDAVYRISAGEMPDLDAMLSLFGEDLMVSVRPSSEDPDWGGPSAILNIGINDTVHEKLVQSHGETAANALYLRFIQAYAVNVARLDPDEFDTFEPSSPNALQEALKLYEEETDSYFPQDPKVQLAEILRSMARAWEGTTARLLRQAKSAPADAGLGLVVQKMALGVGRNICGSGVIYFVNHQTGQQEIRGRYLCKSQGRRVKRSRRPRCNVFDEGHAWPFDRRGSARYICRFD